MGQIFDILIVNPMTNALLLLYELLGRNFVLAILALTVVIRAITLPLTLRQQISMARMSSMQPKVKEIQEKYKGDQQKMMAELNKIGAGPGAQLGGCLPMLLQFPVLIGLFNAINRTLSVNPLSLLDLGKHIYSFLPNLSSLVPINSQFLLWDLGQPDKLYVIPVLVVLTTFLSNKLMTPQSQDPQMAQTNQMMQWMMPFMFGFFMLSSPVGLGMYWLVSNLLGIGQYYITKPTMDKARAQYSLVGATGTPAMAGGGKTGATRAPITPAQLSPPPKSKIKAKPNLVRPVGERKDKKGKS